MGRKTAKAPETPPLQTAPTEVEPIVTPDWKSPETAPASAPIPSSEEHASVQTAEPASLEDMSDKQIQEALKNAGFDPGPADGKIGAKTRAAIKEFQRDNGLTVDGKVGAQTRAALSKYLAAPQTPAGELTGSEDDAHNREIQLALKNAGLDPGQIDGKIGPRTRAAIREFQIKQGLSPDGKVKDEDWAELKKFLTEVK